MSQKLKPYKIISSKFLGQASGLYTYELTFNQSMEHTGRWRGVEEGLDRYRGNEIKEEEKEILKLAAKIKNKKQ